MGLGLSAGPLVGAALGAHSWRYPFFGTATLMAIGLVAVAMFLPQQPKPAAKTSLVAPLVRARPSGLFAVSAAAFFYYYAFFTVLAFVPFVLQMSAHAVGLIFFGWGVLLAMFSVIVTPRLQARFGALPVAGASLVVLAILLIVMGVGAKLIDRRLRDGERRRHGRVQHDLHRNGDGSVRRAATGRVRRLQFPALVRRRRRAVRRADARRAFRPVVRVRRRRCGGARSPRSSCSRDAARSTSKATWSPKRPRRPRPQRGRWSSPRSTAALGTRRSCGVRSRLRRRAGRRRRRPRPGSRGRRRRRRRRRNRRAVGGDRRALATRGRGGRVARRLDADRSARGSRRQGVCSNMRSPSGRVRSSSARRTATPATGSTAVSPARRSARRTAGWRSSSCASRRPSPRPCRRPRRIRPY